VIPDLSPSPLALALWLVWVPSSYAAALLYRSARKRPRIGALTERANLAVTMALFSSIYALITLDIEIEPRLLAIEDVRVVVRLMFLALGLLPIWWLWRDRTGRLGVDEPDPGPGDGS
jgi:hypothetical protein